MKKMLPIRLYFILISFYAIISCQSSSSEKLEQAKKDNAEATENLNKDRTEYMSDMENIGKKPT